MFFQILIAEFQLVRALRSDAFKARQKRGNLQLVLEVHVAKIGFIKFFASVMCHIGFIIQWKKKKINSPKARKKYFPQISPVFAFFCEILCTIVQFCPCIVDNYFLMWYNIYDIQIIYVFMPFFVPETDKSRRTNYYDRHNNYVWRSNFWGFCTMSDVIIVSDIAIKHYRGGLSRERHKRNIRRIGIRLR